MSNFASHYVEVTSVEMILNNLDVVKDSYLLNNLHVAKQKNVLQLAVYKAAAGVL